MQSHQRSLSATAGSLGARGRCLAVGLALAVIAAVASGCGSDSSSGSTDGGGPDASDGGLDGGADSSPDAADTADDTPAPDGSTDGTTDSGESLVSGPSGELVWDFEDGTLQGFTSVHNDAVAGMGVNNVISEGDSGEQGGGYGLEPIDFNGQRDADHDLVLIRSPAFYLDASQDIRAWTTGGVGDGSQPADADALPADTASAGPHPLGIAVRRASDGRYVAVGNRSAIDDWADLVIPASALADADEELVYLDVIDAFGGQDWGWIVIDDIRAHGWAGPGACLAGTCAEDVACTELPGTFPGYSCGDAGGCGGSPCFAGVECTNRPGQTPNFECGDCPEGTSGDGITCTSDAVAPAVVSTVPTDGQTIRFIDGAFNPGEVNRLVITFDRNVLESGTTEQPLTAVAEHLDSDFSQALEVRTRQGGADLRVLTLDSAGTAYTAFPAGDYEVTIENVRSSSGGVLATYTWGFTARTCGDGTCDADESSCTCTDDCGTCAGCCRYDGGAPASVCRPGTANDECGNNGQSCGVCDNPDVCVNGEGCG